MLLLVAVRPSLEYGNECNNRQANALESTIILEGAKINLRFSSRTCTEAVRVDMGLNSLSIGIRLG
jgi:hypothetical protein